jgi:hypothetical protein
MIERKKRSVRPLVLVAWTLIWFGTILAVNPRATWSQLGAVLWAAGLAVQLLVVARWLIGRPASGQAVTGGKPRRVPTRV